MVSDNLVASTILILTFAINQSNGQLEVTNHKVLDNVAINSLWKRSEENNSRETFVGNQSANNPEINTNIDRDNGGAITSVLEKETSTLLGIKSNVLSTAIPTNCILTTPKSSQFFAENNSMSYNETTSVI